MTVIQHPKIERINKKRATLLVVVNNVVDDMQSVIKIFLLPHLSATFQDFSSNFCLILWFTRQKPRPII